MKTTLIALAGAVAALSVSAARADNNFPFDDPYWKRAETVHGTTAVHADPQPAQSRGAYDLVDNYNP
jgi:hypothetical protein